ASLALAQTSLAQTSPADAPATLEPFPTAAWQDPPRELRPVARWWWPGGSVEAAALARQLQQMKDAGFGAVELQPLLLGLGEEDFAADPKIRSVGEPAFRRSVAVAAAAAARIGLDFDLTLGSGWPGGLPTPKVNAERQLLMSTLDVTGPSRFEGKLPAPPGQSYRRAVEWVLDVLGPPDPDVKVVAAVAARLGAARGGIPVLEDARVIAGTIKGAIIEGAIEAGRLAWDVPEGSWRIFVFYENATEHFVMGGAFPGAEADARVVDHLSQRGAEALLAGYAAPLLAALPPGSVRELFVDSFELMGELPFTADFLTAFEAHKGYDLTPHLPLLFRKGGESKYGEMVDFFGRSGGPLYLAGAPELAERVREDYEDVRRSLFEQRFVGHIAGWAQRRGLALRLQAHGGYGDYLDTYARADLPESEGLFAGGSFDFLKLAASAAHVADRRFASSEAFITLRLRGTRLSADEMRLLAGRAYSAGINRLAFHGVPYPYTRVDGKAWYPFPGGFGRVLAGPLPMSSRIDAGFLALAELADFNRFLARLTLAMSYGEPAADVAWLRSEPGYPDSASLQLGRVDAQAGESAVTRALRGRGLGHDRVSRRMLAGAHARQGVYEVGARQYRALLLDPLEIAEPELVERIVALAEAGIPVLALGALPRRAPGLVDASARDGRVRAATKQLAELVVRVPELGRLEPLLAAQVQSGLVEPPPGERLAVSLERRRSAAGDTLLVFNESWSPRRAQLRFVRGAGALTRWDPRSGARVKLREKVAAGDVISLELAAAETLILTLQRPDRPGTRQEQSTSSREQDR
ncbi:MAG: hypothetical protein JRG96_19890, partial [Deltaproteobacteria bacterium]|nr:hypothetical protein [Deltaproteobacteria bacterium]